VAVREKATDELEEQSSSQFYRYRVGLQSEGAVERPGGCKFNLLKPSGFFTYRQV